MEKTITLIILILMAGCVQENIETTTLQDTTATTTSTTTTTSLSYVNISSSEGCDSYNISEERDNCYLTLAVNDLNMSLCGKIEKLSKLKLCEMTIGGQRDGSSTIKGYVMNASTRLAIRGVKIHAINLEDAEELAVDTTDKKGFYSMSVPSGRTYEIMAVEGEHNYTQKQYARNNYEHELWFMIP